MYSRIDGGPSTGSTRRIFLTRMASAGMLATAGTGLLALARPAGARAQSAPLLAPGQAPLRSNGQILAVPAGCCFTCTIDENHCRPDPCPSGYCCYHCTGCGGSFNECLTVNGTGCATKSFTYC